MITSAAPVCLDALEWLKLNRAGWAIESELHQRLDTSYKDDRCRVQSGHGIWIFGMFRRLANSLFMEWRSAQRRPDHVTTTDFQALLAQKKPTTRPPPRDHEKPSAEKALMNLLCAVPSLLFRFLIW